MGLIPLVRWINNVFPRFVPRLITLYINIYIIIILKAITNPIINGIKSYFAGLDYNDIIVILVFT